MRAQAEEVVADRECVPSGDRFVETCPHPVLLLTGGGVVQRLNGAALRAFGTSIRCGDPIEALVFDEDRQQFRAAAMLFEAVGGFKGPFRFLHSNGEARTGDLTWFRIDPFRSAIMIIDAHDLQRQLQQLYERIDRFEAAAVASNEGWWDWSKDACVVKFSRRSRAILGIDDDDEIQPLDDWRSRIHDEDRSAFDRVLREISEGRSSSLRLEQRILRESGWAYVVVRGTALVGSDARFTRIVGTVADVTNERLSREDQLRHRRLFEHSLDGLLIVDRTGLVVEINEVGRSLCGATDERRIVLQEAFDDAANGILREGMKSASDGFSWNRELFVRNRRGGGPTELCAALFPIDRDSHGRPMMLGVVLHDVTLQKRAQRSDLEHREALAHMLRLSTMGEMAGGIAHDLNQPLASIVNYVDGCLSRLQKGRVEAESLIDALQRTKYLAHLSAEIVFRMRRFIRKSKPQVGPTRPELLVQETIEFLEPTSRPQQIALSIAFDEDLPEIEVDAIQIEQVLMNLAANAIDSLKKSPSTDRRIHFQVRCQGDAVVFSVADNGHGVPDEWKQRIFEPFVTSKVDQASLGLGLSISRSIVEQFGGSLWLDESTPEFSTVFKFRLPKANGMPTDAVSVL